MNNSRDRGGHRVFHGRIHLFELEDQRWFPEAIRDAGTDFIRFVAEIGNPYKPIIPLLSRALDETGSREILDLCSGGGGPMAGLVPQLAENGWEGTVTLTDKFPNLAAFEYLRGCSDGAIGFIEQPVDASAVEPHLTGFRTLFTSFHHFPPDTASRILQDAVDQRRPIGVFEQTERSILPALTTLIGPLFVLLVTPFIRPVRWSRFLWTYLIPVVPFYVMWDGFVSCLRTYSPDELQGVVDGLDCEDYVWEIGQEASRPAPITYLLGYPARESGILGR